MNTRIDPLQPQPEVRIISYRLIVLLLVVITAGASQGLLLPLLTILLERGGIPDDINGLNSMALYIGTFSTMFFIERPVTRFGFRPVMLAGIVLITAATLLFPLTAGSLAAWFVLRILIGIGDSGLHFASQLWIVSHAPARQRGKFISLYGMSYGVGFSIGPLGINLLHFGDAAPFLFSAALYTIVLLLALRLPRDRPEPRAKGEAAGASRYKAVYRIAWYALLPAMLYGVMEASMNSSFPLYGSKIGLDRQVISGLLPAIGIGGLLLQLPLGIWSDRIGRLPVLIGCGRWRRPIVPGHSACRDKHSADRAAARGGGRPCRLVFLARPCLCGGHAAQASAAGLQCAGIDPFFRWQHSGSCH